MSVRNIDIDRMSIAVHGISSLVVEQAMSGLEAELHRRLGAQRGNWEAAAVPELRIGPLDLPPGSDAMALREMIAEGLMQALLQPSSPNALEGN